MLEELTPGRSTSNIKNGVVDDDNLHLVKIQLEMLTIDHWPRKASKWVNVLVHSGSFQIRDVVKSQMLSSDIDKLELQQVDAEVFVCVIVCRSRAGQLQQAVPQLRVHVCLPLRTFSC